MMTKTLAAAALAVHCLSAGSLRAQSECPSRRAPTSGSGPVSPAEVCRVLSALANDSMEGRGTGTLGGAKAARFIAQEMRAAGLEPGGDSGYFQRVPLIFTRATRNGVTSTRPIGA